MNSITYLAHSVDQALRGGPDQDPTIKLEENDNINKPDIMEVPASIIEPIAFQLGNENREDKNTVEVESQENLEVTSQTFSYDDDEEFEKQMTPSFLRRIIYIIWFIPHFTLIRPLLFFWYICTFPLTLLEKNGSLSKHEDQIDEKRVEKSIKPKQGYRTEEEDSSGAAEIFSSGNNLTSSVILELDEDAEDVEPASKQQQQTLSSTSTPITEELKSPIATNVLTKASKFPFPKYVFPISVPKKTLILDLDETLVHSISKSSRSTKNGHMIEVKISQVATLYYVHKRPYCDHFLQRASKWFDLVIFTASVKEYADPVIDWLETEKKYFSKRYYRNHCTLREGEGYIKDLTNVNPDLHRLIIIDNSPISYALHEDNAILVEGWINDDSDTDLLNLLPMLEALKYTNDVRPLLSLKNAAAAFGK